jgi:hypothetical protein
MSSIVASSAIATSRVRSSVLLLCITWYAVLTLLSMVPHGDAQAVLVANGSNWKFWDKGPLADSTWSRLGFGDGSWAVGQAPLGYGIDFLRTTTSFGTVSTKRHITSYFRKSFIASYLPTYGGYLNLTLWVDDGAVVYFNGNEALRVNIPANMADNATLLASSTVGTPIQREYTLPLSVLAPGGGASNVVAVSVHQDSLTSIDCMLDLALRITIFPTPSPSPTISLTPSSSATQSKTASVTPSLSYTSTASLSSTASATPLPAGPEQVKFTDIWKYYDGGMDLSGVFSSPAYVDDAWRTGRAMFGTFTPASDAAARLLVRCSVT